MLKLKHVQTEDGSYTLFDTSLNVAYRSMQGALTESEYVFVKPALEAAGPKLRVFELGLGAGLNFIRTCAGFSGKLEYFAVDHRPVPPEFITPTGVSERLLKQVLEHQGPLRRVQHELVSLSLEVCSCLDSTLPKSSVDAIFHDPFGPSDNPESWSTEIFAWERERLAPNALILTYCAAGHVRRAMREAGLFVASRPGPGRKREVTVAAASEAALSQLDDLTKIWAPQ